MSTTIKIKNSNVAGKIPAAGSLESAELALNIKDQKLYSKDADGNVFEIGNAANVPGGGTPPGSGNEIGDLFFDTTDNTLLYWDGSAWKPVVSGETIGLDDLNDVTVDGAADGQVLAYDANSGQWVAVDTASLAVDVDLSYTAAPDKGTVVNNAGDDAELPLVDETNAGLMSPADYSKLAATPGVISGPLAPNNPSPGDIWIDTGDCPPTINIWDDCDDPGNPTWKPIGGGGGGGCVQGPVQITSSNGTELNSTLTAVGGNGIDEDATLTAAYEWTGAKTGIGSSIIADVEGNYTVTATITCVDGSTLSSSAVWTVSDSYVDMANNTPPVIAVVGEGIDGAYEGNSMYVVTNATVLNGQSPSVIETQWFKDDVADGTGSIYTIGAGDEGAVITAKQLFRDLRNNELLSLASNAITIVERPADAITFTAVITDDGTANANKVGSVLTASATNIVGGVAPVEYGFEWKSAGATVGATKTYTLQSSDVGKIIQCDVTVAEPDGTNPETRTATYTETIEILGTINKPVVLAPADGAGSGTSRPIVTDAITAVEGSGVAVCETELIDNVTPEVSPVWSSYLSSNTGVVPSFPVTNAFDGDTATLCSPESATANNEQINTWNGGGSVFITASKFEIYTNAASADIKNELYVEFEGGGSDTLDLTGNPAGWQVYNNTTGKRISLFKTIKSASGSSSFFIYAVKADGNILIDNNETVTLTFPSAQGFDCFEPGDVVQGIDTDNVYTLKYADDSAAFSPTPLSFNDARLTTLTTNGQPNQSPGSGSSRGTYWEFTTPTEFSFANFTSTSAGFSNYLFYSDDGVIWTLAKHFDPPVPCYGPNGEFVYFKEKHKYWAEMNDIDDGSGRNLQNWYFSFDSSNSSVKVISKDDSDPYTITVDGGTWTTSDKLVKETPYDTKLTLAGAKDLDVLNVGDVVKMGMDADVPYQPVSDSIVSVSGTAPAITLTLSGPTDLAYFRRGDVVQELPDVTIVSISEEGDANHPSITVDSGDWDPTGANGDSEVTCQSPLKAPTDWTIEKIEGNTLSLSHATPNDGAQVWVANDNQAGTDFFVAGPNIVDEPLLTADVRLESSLFATTPADADTLKNIVWELNGAEQNAGTSNPYTPTLNTNTTYTVRVKHQGNALEDSPWSDSTTFTTGATRNLYTYYKERVEVLENRIAGIEADEVVDDATDVTLLTVIADLIERVQTLEGGA
jgi:hypothetical protein